VTSSVEACPGMEQKQGFATAVASQPEPAQHQDLPRSAEPGMEQKQGFATAVASPATI
jgi:hypothetical protein